MDAYLPNKADFRETPLEDKTVRILLVEDNPGDVLIMKELLRMTGIDYSMRHVSTLKETLMVCLEESFDIILLDLGLPDSTGAETLKKILVFNTGMPVVVMTGLDDEDTALESLRQGAQDYLVKSRLTSDSLLRGIKYGIERKKIQELIRKNAMQFAMLSSTTSAINECEDIPSIYHVTCRNIVQILYKAGVAGFTLDVSPRIFASGTEVFDAWFKYIESLTGIDLNKSVIHSGAQLDFLKALLKDGKLHQIPAHLPKGQGPDKDNVQIRTISAGNSPQLYVIGFTRNEIIYGGALIIVYHGLGEDDISIIETVCNQVSLSLHRKAIEKDLKDSEDRFRKLSKELELKVKERTHDLESSNYLLNQELIEHHHAEDALKKSELNLKELNATKDKFFSIIAHDLKNPFTCLLGSTEVLNEKLESMDTNKIKDLVQIINDSAKSGYSVLQNLLLWSKSQTGMITFSPEQIDLKKVIDNCISDLKGCYPRKEINIVTETVGEMNLFTDRNLIVTILRNLVDNSLKFTPIYGTIKIKAENNKDEVVISVSDTGIGIPGENLKDLFRLDRKFTRPGTDKEQGTGLGLKICKEFTEIQGGTISVRSTVNKGSEVVFTIPLKSK